MQVLLISEYAEKYAYARYQKCQYSVSDLFVRAIFLFFFCWLPSIYFSSTRHSGIAVVVNKHRPHRGGVEIELASQRF